MPKAEGRLEALARSRCRTHVGTHRHPHADEAGEGRSHGPDDEPDGDPLAENVSEDSHQYYRNDGNRLVLAREERIRAFLHRSRNFLHLGTACILLAHPHRGNDAVDNAGDAADQGK
jgi:hypothetical protein